MNKLVPFDAFRRAWPLLLSIGILAGAGRARAAAASTPLREGVDVQKPEAVEAARRKITLEFADAVDPDGLDGPRKAAILEKYRYLDPLKEVPKDLLDKAVAYLDVNRSKFANQDFVTIVDYRPRSDAYRLFVVDMRDGSVEKYHTTHGAGSVVGDEGYARSFGDVPGSNKSSLGFVRTAEVYSGTYALSLRLDGLSPGDNSNLRARAIVVHGWDGAKEENVLQGLSEGCLALDWSVKDRIIAQIKEGSLLYAGVSGATGKP